MECAFAAVRMSRTNRLLPVVALALSSGFLASALADDPPKPKKPKPAPTLPAIPVPDPTVFYKGAFKLAFTPSTIVQNQLAGLIARAKTRVDMAVFDIDEPIVVEALLELHGRKKPIRVVMDSKNRNEHNDPLAEAKILRTDPANWRPFMHTKLVAIDRRFVLAGSANATTDAFMKEDNNAFFIDSPPLAKLVETFVDQLWAGKFGKKRGKSPVAPAVKVGDASIQLYFSPDNDPLDRVLQEIAGAKKTIRFACFNISHQDILAELLRVKKDKKVTISGVVDGSEWKNGRVAKTLEEAGCNVLMDGNPSLMHNKLFIIDDETVITGSFNFSANAVENNDEDMLVIKSPEIAKAFKASYDRIEKMAKKLPEEKKPATATSSTTGPVPVTPGVAGALDRPE